MIKQNKSQYDLDRQAAKIYALLSGNVIKYEFLTCEDVLLEKDLLEKAATMKTFEYSPLGKELKTQTDISKKQYQKLDNFFEFDKIIKKEEPMFKNYSKSNLIYNGKYSFYKYYLDSKKFDNLSVKSKYSFLHKFFYDLSKFKILKITKQETEKKKPNMHDRASELYNELLETYFDEYYYLSHAKTKKESQI